MELFLFFVILFLVLGVFVVYFRNHAGTCTVEEHKAMIEKHRAEIKAKFDEGVK